MAERALIEAFTARLRARDERLLVGPGDDAAVVRPAGALAVTSTDTTVLGVHLPLNQPRVTPAVVGHRALATALSDLAAMGVPAGEAYVALTLPPSWGDDEVLELFVAIEELAEQTGTTIAGGDISDGGTLVVTVTVVGWAPDEDALLRRTAARVGDLIGVTGRLGGSVSGLSLLQGAPTLAAHDDRPVRDALIERYLRPLPRLEDGVRLRAAGARAGIDLSDGIATDAGHVGRASGVVLAIDVDLLPRQLGVDELAAATGGDPAELAATGGEDFELLVTMPPEHAATATGLTWIGEVRAAVDGEQPGVLLHRRGIPVRWAGWEHRG